MKNMFESEEIFEAYARIDFGYYLLADVKKELDKMEYREALVKAIDIQTGYERAMQIEQVNSAIHISRNIIKDKKIIEADTKPDEEFLKGLETALVDMQKVE